MIMSIETTRKLYDKKDGELCITIGEILKGSTILLSGFRADYIKIVNTLRIYFIFISFTTSKTTR